VAGRGGEGRDPQGPTPGSPADTGEPANPVEVARAICLRQLTMGPRSKAQLAEALSKRNVPEAAAEQVLARFVEVGLIDDAAFAVSWVESRHRGRGLARRALAQELRHKGIADAESSAALDTLGRDQEEETARLLVERKLRGTSGLEAGARVRRLSGMLARKGYPPGLALHVVREALANERVVAVGDDEVDEALRRAEHEVDS